MVENEDYEEQSTSALHEAMEQLDDRSRNILQRRWLDDAISQPYMNWQQNIMFGRTYSSARKKCHGKN